MPKSIDEIHTMSYEQAFAELEEIVYRLESNQKTLEESITLFERGQALAQHCAGLLDQAELRVRVLSGQEDTPGGEPDSEENFESK